MMRQLTDSERSAMQAPLCEYWVEATAGILPLERRVDFEAGFAAALDHSAAQIAALTAERDALREALKPFAKVAESHSFAPSVPPEKCILWNKTSSIQGTLAEITLADCIEARRALDNT